MSRESAPRLVIALAAVVLLWICVRVAWVGDDAYITLRSVENWFAGNGLRWNAADRVQVFTHPLWMLVLAAARSVTGEVFFGTIVVSLVLSMLAIVALLRSATGAAGVVAIAALLACSRAFCDYSTSGLETPLTYVLLLWFVRSCQREDGAARRYFTAVFVASLLACNRMDLALLCLPAVLSTMRGLPPRVVIGGGVFATAPFVAWLVCALVYYGSLLPVTAHAKAFGTGISSHDLLMQGIYYVGHTAWNDPVLSLTVVVGCCCGFYARATQWLALGAVVYLCYVIKVGGDFMAGRFLLPPFIVAIAVLAPRLAGARAWGIALVAIAAAFVPGVPAWLLPPSSDTPMAEAEIETGRGIVDERRVHFSRLGLLADNRELPRFGQLHELVWPDGRERRWFLINGSVGVAGFQLGARGHLVDPLLCDPLMARLPARDSKRWRIGHVLRRAPEGYFESLASGENRILHPGLHRYYEALRTLTQAPVLLPERWSALWQMTTGAFDDDLRAYIDEHYFEPPRVPLSAASLPTDVALGTFWFDEPRLHLIYDGGVEVRFDGAQKARQLRVQTMGLVAFRCRFVSGGKVVGERMLSPLPSPPDVQGLRAIAGLRVEQVDVPAEVVAFDALWLDAVEVPGSDKAPGPPGIGAITLDG